MVRHWYLAYMYDGIDDDALEHDNHVFFYGYSSKFARDAEVERVNAAAVTEFVEAGLLDGDNPRNRALCRRAVPCKLRDVHRHCGSASTKYPPEADGWEVKGIGPVRGYNQR